MLIDVPERLIALDGGWSGERKVEEKMKNKFWERGQRALHTEKNSQSFGGTTCGIFTSDISFFFFNFIYLLWPHSVFLSVWAFL